MDDKKDAPEAEDSAVMQQSYPSPIVDSTEAQYYEQLAQHRELEPQMEQQEPQPEHHGLPAISEHQEQHEHHELHQLQGLQDSPAAQQHSSRPPVSADELQLAAQLTQGLAPMMAAAVQDQGQDQQPMQQQDAQEGQVQPQEEPDLQKQLEASLQNHEREMQSHEHELQNHNHELQNHELQDVMQQHPGQPPQDHYAQNPPSHPHLPHHMSMEHLQTHGQYQLPDATPPRKRSKVSRACDECRRKKIKCDAQSDATDQPCSNCRRSNAQCLFSRVPQKRGPSKGYIKELADRLNMIEGRLNTNSDGLERRQSGEAFPSPGAGEDSRKRPFSSISSGAFQTPSPNRVSPAFILPYPPPTQIPPNPPDLAMKQAPPVQYPAASGDMSPHGQPEMMDGISQNGLPQGSSHQVEQLPEIDDSVFNRYLEVIHPIFPVLASSKARVQSLLWQAPPGLQNAFYNAFFSMIKHFLPGPAGPVDGDPAITWRLLTEWEAECKPRSSVTDMVRLQTLVMAAISVDFHGIAPAKGQPRAPSKAEILGRAVGLGYSMDIYRWPVDPHPNSELDTNSDDNVALRAWWVLVMLDRWHALGMAKPPLIANQAGVARPGLKHIVGDAVYALIRMSYILGLALPIAMDPLADPMSLEGASVGRLATGISHILDWVFPNERTDYVLDLAYWHARLVSELFAPDLPERPGNIIQATKVLVGLLVAKNDLVSPVTHHFVILAALGLIECRRFTNARDEVARLTKEFLECPLAASPLNNTVRDKLAESQARVSVADPNTAPTATNTSQNLHQLADLATAVDGSAPAQPSAPMAAPAESNGQHTDEAAATTPSVGATAGADAAGAGTGAGALKPEEVKENGNIQHQQPHQEQQHPQQQEEAGMVLPSSAPLEPVAT
ncbi:hypothetical protein C7999DRAFT_39194 [Corynascus novoguineensis]|uniref:Zn(2)-C6 fungal-type domain-containing protein n=1 Tax=Corynascus novoguineensis TaxID=1126955 RepID=A0AAN7HSS0_9PEZI|nr:hypothetical protein C7999DRAFT_39194 [Corynascus novoguineensis]